MALKLFRIFKQLVCKHKYMPAGEYFDDHSNGHVYKKYIWKCTKCGKTKY